MSSRPAVDQKLRLWRQSVKMTTLWALILIFLFVAVVLTRRVDRLEVLLLGPRVLGYSAAQMLTAANITLGLYLLLDLRKAWKMRGPMRRGHVAGVVLAVALVCALQVGIEVVSSVAKRFAGHG